MRYCKYRAQPDIDRFKEIPLFLFWNQKVIRRMQHILPLAFILDKQK
jgi:hypothetical protein